MGRGSSRQTKDLVPSSRITKELAALSLSVFQSLSLSIGKYVALRPYFYCDKFDGTYWTLSRSLFLGWNEAVGGNFASWSY